MKTSIKTPTKNVHRVTCLCAAHEVTVPHKSGIGRDRWGGNPTAWCACSWEGKNRKFSFSAWIDGLKHVKAAR